MAASLAPADRKAGPTPRFDAPHAVERRVRRALTSQPSLDFKSLNVHRTDDGVCLTGIVESSGDDADVARLIREVAGVERVIDQLIVRRAAGE